MVLVTKGRVRWRIEDQVVVSGPGTLSWTFPWQEHGGGEADLSASELYFVIFALAHDYPQRPRKIGFAPSLAIPPDTTRAATGQLLKGRTQLVTANHQLQWLLRQIVHESRHDSFAREVCLAGLARCAIVELTRLVAQQHTADIPAANSIQRVRAFAHDLELHCRRPWTADDMAAACGLGRTQFAKLFERETGDTPSVGLRRARIRAACRFLRETDRPITQITLELSFSSSQHFASVFREFARQSPRAYRDAMRR